jgi:iron complex transport system substrate-binding protein
MVELVLALGLGERLVGVAFLDGPIPTEPGPGGGPAAAPDLPVLSDRVPAQEVVLETAPDLVLAGWESVLTASGAGARDSYAALGIATYVAPVACRSGPDRPDRITFEDVFAQTLEVGRILGVPERAERLVAAQRAQLAGVAAREGLSALWYSSGTATPFVGGGLGGPQMMLEALGLSNIMADIPDSWASVSWEAVAVREPDVIVLVDAVWNPVAQKRQLLAAMPVTRGLAAVAEERYLVIDFAAAEPGVRSVPALLDLAAQLEGLGGAE